MLKLIDRYILLELIKPFLAGIGAFVIVMLSNTLFFYAELIVKNNIPPSTVIKNLLYNLPAIMVTTFPVGYLFATLIVLGRLARDSEITGFRACGVSFLRIISPILIMSLVISALTFFINETIVPWSNQKCVELYKEMVLKNPLPPIKENYFFKDASNRYFYVDKVDRKNNIVKDVVIIDRVKPGFPQIITGKEAKREKTKWILQDGMIRKFDDNGYIVYEAKFEKMELEIDFEPSMWFSDQKSVQELNSSEAYSYINSLSKQGTDQRTIMAMLVDYYTKYSLPLATFFAALIAAPIGVKFSKMGAYIGVSVSIALVFVWYLAYSYGRELGSIGAISPLLGAWIHNLIFAVIGGIMLLDISRR